MYISLLKSNYISFLCSCLMLQYDDVGSLRGKSHKGFSGKSRIQLSLHYFIVGIFPNFSILGRLLKSITTCALLLVQSCQFFCNCKSAKISVGKTRLIWVRVDINQWLYHIYQCIKKCFFYSVRGKFPSHSAVLDVLCLLSPLCLLCVSVFLFCGLMPQSRLFV